jgi:hypothetical protein
VSQTYQFQAHETHGCSGKRDICRKRTLGQNPPRAKGVKTQRQSDTSLAYKA